MIRQHQRFVSMSASKLICLFATIGSALTDPRPSFINSITGAPPSKDLEGGDLTPTRVLFTSSRSLKSGLSYSSEISRRILPLEEKTKPCTLAWDAAESYPCWLGKSTPFGSWKPDGANGTGALTCVGLDLLQFGPPQQVVLGGLPAVWLPITGGLLALRRDHEEGDAGGIEFSCRSDQGGFVFRTDLSAFQSSILGRHGDEGLRAKLYKSTQAIYHTSVMRRYHRHFLEKVGIPQ